MRSTARRPLVLILALAASPLCATEVFTPQHVAKIRGV